MLKTESEQFYEVLLSRENPLHYFVRVKKNGASFINAFKNFNAEKIDRRYLLKKDTPGECGQIFGIADDQREATDRLYNEAEISAQEHAAAYSTEENPARLKNQLEKILRK